MTKNRLFMIWNRAENARTEEELQVLEKKCIHCNRVLQNHFWYPKDYVSGTGDRSSIRESNAPNCYLKGTNNPRTYFTYEDFASFIRSARKVKLKK